MGSMFSLFSEEVKIVFMRLVKCMKNIDNFCSPLNKLCSIIKMLPILDNMCCSTKHWLMFRPSKNGVYLSCRGPSKYHLWLFRLWCYIRCIMQCSQGCLNVAPSAGCWSVYTEHSVSQKSYKVLRYILTFPSKLEVTLASPEPAAWQWPAGAGASEDLVLVAALATEGDSNNRLLFLLITFFSPSGVDNPGDNVLQPDDGDQVGGGVPVPRLQEPTRHHERRQGGGPGLDALLGGARSLLDAGDNCWPSPGFPPWLPPRQVCLPGLVHGALGQEWLKPGLHSGERKVKYLAI